MLITPRKVLAISPHPDDVELGMGATISKLARQGAQIRILVLSSAEKSLPTGFSADGIREECRSALGILGVQATAISFENFQVRYFAGQRQEILERLVECDREYSPDTVFCPSLTDTHQDHFVVAAECVRAFRTRSVFGYELPWNNDGFKPVVSMIVSSKDVENKELALARYVSQRSRAYFEPGLLTNLARLRASVTKSQYAEAFEVIRAVIL